MKTAGRSDATCTNVAPKRAQRRISTKDAAKIYGIPERTIRRWHTEGRLTDPERDGHRLLWNVDEIDQMAQLRHGRMRLRRTNVMTDTHG